MIESNANTPVPPKPDRSLLVMIGSVITGLLVIIGIGLLVGALIVRSGARDTSAIPFGINTRALPVPTQTNVGAIYPATLGDFTRSNITGTVNGFTAIYARGSGQGSDQITINGGKQLSFAAAQQVILLERERLPAANQSERLLTAQPNLTWWYDVRNNKAQLYYNHDQWFFLITANSAATLEAFMAVNPY